jgi:hypothetical protein
MMDEADTNVNYICTVGGDVDEAGLSYTEI